MTQRWLRASLTPAVIDVNLLILTFHLFYQLILDLSTYCYIMVILVFESTLKSFIFYVLSIEYVLKTPNRSAILSTIHDKLNYR